MAHCQSTIGIRYQLLLERSATGQANVRIDKKEFGILSRIVINFTREKEKLVVACGLHSTAVLGNSCTIVRNMRKRRRKHKSKASEKSANECPAVTLSKSDKASLLKLDEDLLTVTGEAVSVNQSPMLRRPAYHANTFRLLMSVA